MPAAAYKRLSLHEDPTRLKNAMVLIWVWPGRINLKLNKALDSLNLSMGGKFLKWGLWRRLVIIFTAIIVLM